MRVNHFLEDDGGRRKVHEDQKKAHEQKNLRFF